MVNGLDERTLENMFEWLTDRVEDDNQGVFQHEFKYYVEDGLLMSRAGVENELRRSGWIDNPDIV